MRPMVLLSTLAASRASRVGVAFSLRPMARAPALLRMPLVRMASTDHLTTDHLIADIQVLPTPLGTADDAYKHVDAAIEVIAASGLDHSVNALGTTIEGPADAVWATARAAFDASIDAYIVFGNWVSRGWVGSRSAMWADGGARELSCGLN